MESRCPKGKTELVLTQFNKTEGFSDRWSYFDYIEYSLCRFRIVSDKPQSNIVLEFDRITGSAEFTLMIMSKDTFEFPKDVQVINKDSQQISFRVSGEYYEFLIYIEPSSVTSGSYRLSTWLEEGYQPTAFDQFQDEPEEELTSQPE